MKINYVALPVVFCIALASCMKPNSRTFNASFPDAVVTVLPLSGGRVVPPVVTGAAGSTTMEIAADDSSISGILNTTNIDSQSITLIDIHLGPTGGSDSRVAPMFKIMSGSDSFSDSVSWKVTAKDFRVDKTLSRLGVKSFEDAISNIKKGNAYLDIHTTNFPKAGEIRANFPEPLKPVFFLCEVCGPILFAEYTQCRGATAGEQAQGVDIVCNLRICTNDTANYTECGGTEEPPCIDCD